MECKKDENCTAIYDLTCGENDKYFLCYNDSAVLSSDGISCIHEKIIVGRLSTFFKFT